MFWRHACCKVVNEIWELGSCRKCAPKESTLEINDPWRRQCGCIKTSDKLRRIIEQFPTAPPPSPAHPGPSSQFNNAGACISAFCTVHQSPFPCGDDCATDICPDPVVRLKDREVEPECRWSFNLVTDLVQLLQLSVTATALALYYLIYCYMQLVYFTLRSALYFHNADGPMKITIGVVTLTSLIVGFNLLVRIERLFIFN